MTNRLRSILVASGAATILTIPAVMGCSREQRRQEEQRRALLTPSDHRQKLQEEERKRKLVDDDGELIPSDRTVAGILMPRGLGDVRAVENRYYLTSSRVSFEALDRYFAKRLFTGQIERESPDSVRYVAANIKGDPKALKVSVRISRIVGPEDNCEVFIQQLTPPPPVMGVAETQAKLREERKFAR
jgi:hypothetical protein